MHTKINAIIRMITSACLVIMMLASNMSTANMEDVKYVVRVGCFPLNGFFNINSVGNVSGYGAEYMEAVASYANWAYEFVPYKNWEEALQALDDNKIDMLAPAQRTPEREDKFLFGSFPIGTEYGSLLTREDNQNLVFEDYRGFEGMKVGCVATLIFQKEFDNYTRLNHFKVNKVYYNDTQAVLAALQKGEVDAVLVNMMVKTTDTKLLARFGTAPFYFVLSQHGSFLRTDLNRALDKLTANHPSFQRELNSKYYTSLEEVPFSKAEVDYIARKRTIKVADSRDSKPYSYIDEKTGNIVGFDRKILDQITQISGLKFEVVPSPFNRNVSEMAQQKKVDMIAGVETSSETQLHKNNHSDVYLNLTKHFLSNTDDISSLQEHQRVAIQVVTRFQLQELQRAYPGVEFISYGDAEKCVEAVERGEADVVLSDRYALESVLDSPRHQDFRYLSIDEMPVGLCYQLTNAQNDAEQKILLSILNKSLHRISERDRETMMTTALEEVRYQYSLWDVLYKYRWSIGFILLMLVIGGAAMANNLKTRRKADLAVAENEMKLRHITNNINGGVVVLKGDASMQIEFANDGFLDLIGCSREDFDKTEGSYLTYVHPEDFSKIVKIMKSQEKELSIELRIQRQNGSYVPTIFNCTVGEMINGSRELYCVILDMTEQHKLLEQLRIENKRTELILNLAQEIFYEMNIAQKKVITSHSFVEQLGWNLPSELNLVQAQDMVDLWRVRADKKQDLQKDLETVFEEHKSVVTLVPIESHIDQRYIWCELLHQPILGDNGQLVSIIGLITNVDQQIREKDKLVRKSQRDSLTSLYNKEAFAKLVKEDLQEKTPGNKALIFLDLDHFKTLNDTLGHLEGDKAICDAAMKLKNIFTAKLVSRFGGDEYCIYTTVADMAELEAALAKIVDSMATVYQVEDKQVQITCSCGAAISLGGMETYEELLKRADAALYQAKENGRNQYFIAK